MPSELQQLTVGAFLTERLDNVSLHSGFFANVGSFNQSMESVSPPFQWLTLSAFHQGLEM